MTVNIPIDVEQTRDNTDISLELGANDTYHSSLQGRAESNQHPISAISNLEETIETINTNIENCLDVANSKQDEIADLQEIREGAERGATAAQPSDIKNSTIYIQRNAIPVDNFTLNQSTNKTINIIVPTQANEVHALPDTTKYTANLSVAIDPSTFVMTLQLKDQDGNNIGTEQSIDLPLETMVVSGEYDEDNKQIVLVLKNGTEIRFSVADLIDGLQSEITVSNKLSADLVDDTNTTHKFISSTERTTWNEKQDRLIEGNNIKIQDNIISTQTDNTSITTEDGKIRTIGVYNLGGILQTDWAGTTAEYERDVQAGIITSNTVCLITDD